MFLRFNGCKVLFKTSGCSLWKIGFTIMIALNKENCYLILKRVDCGLKFGLLCLPFKGCLYHLQEVSLPVLKDSIMEALKVLIGTENLTISFNFEMHMFFISLLIPSFHFVVSDVRNHPVLIHCKRGKVLIDLQIFFSLVCL